jgi:hypothetical protein
MIAINTSMLMSEKPARLRTCKIMGNSFEKYRLVVACGRGSTAGSSCRPKPAAHEHSFMFAAAADHGKLKACVFILFTTSAGHLVASMLAAQPSQFRL